MKQHEPAAKRRRPNLFLRFLAFLVTLVLVVGAVVLVVNYDKLNFDSIRRWFSYRSLERNDSGQAESFYCGSDNNSLFAALGDDLLVCGENSIRLYSGSGTAYIDKTVSLSNPAMDSAGNHALVYDAGGQELFAFANREEVFDLTLEGDLSLLSATVNSSGWSAVTAQEYGYKGSVTVYDPAGSPVMRLNLSSSFVMDAAVSPDNKQLAVLTAGLEDGNFENTVSLYRLDGTSGEGTPEWTWTCSLGNNVVLNLQWDSYGIWCLGDSALTLVSADGEILAAADYGGRYLKEFCQEGDGFAAVLLGKYRAGTSAELTVMDREGQLFTLPVEEQILSLSSAGRYLAVLTADRLDIYTQDLTLYDTLEGTQSAQEVIMRSDGTAMLISGKTARLYVPQ